jgi:hypothetical protein
MGRQIRAGELVLRVQAQANTQADQAIYDDTARDDCRDSRRKYQQKKELDQRIDLILLAYRAQLKEGKARVHRKHHAGARPVQLLIIVETWPVRGGQ